MEAATVSLTTGGRRSTDSGAHAYAASGDTRAYADGGGARTYAGASRARAYATKDERCGVVWCVGADVNGEDKMSLFFFFLEKLCMPMREHACGRSIAQLATSGLTDVVEH
jgi:hypothetical protein